MKKIKLFVFLLMLSLAAAAAHAETVAIHGVEARAALSTLGWTPYVSIGHGPKVVYVVGRPGCTRSAALYATLRGLEEEYEFRWIILEDVGHARSRLFALEDRSAAALESMYGGEDRPAGEKYEQAWESMRVNNVAMWLFMDQIGHTGQYSVPAVVVETLDGAEFRDYDSFRKGGMLSSLSGAVGGRNERHNPDPLLEKIVSSTEKNGDFVASGSVELRLYPDEAAPVVVVLGDNYSLPVASAVGDGWIGLKAFDDYAAGLVYVRKNKGKIELSASGK